jgi:beta-lactamase superfamily II metal-dependent hydrolase
MPVRIHFLNVGHGDCTIIEHHSGRVTMIDINNGDDYDADTLRELRSQYPYFSLAPYFGQSFSYGSLLDALMSDKERLKKGGYNIDLTNPIEYYQKHIGAKPIFRYIQSHPDLDHMRGLVALRQAGIRIENFWDTAHTKKIDVFTRDGDEAEWREYQRLSSGNGGAKVLQVNSGDKRPFFNQDGPGVDGGDHLHVLAPTPSICAHANSCADHNAHSYVLWMHHAGRIVIFGGDATDHVWTDIAKCGARLKCDILKASHHGRDSGFHLEAVKHMKPKHVLVSVGSKPDTDSTHKYRGHCDYIHTTREYGNIVFTISDDGTITSDPIHSKLATSVFSLSPFNPFLIHS